MEWKDKGINLKIHYYHISNEFDNNVIKEELAKKKNCIEDLAYESGTYVSLNAIVKNTENYILLGILYLDESVIDQIISKVSFFVKEIEESLKQRNTFSEGKTENVFNELLQSLNNGRVVRKVGNALKKDSLNMFTGILMRCDGHIALKDTIILHLIKEGLGDNDTDSIFFDMRKKGCIYSGYSRVFIETGSLLTGCFSEGSDRMIYEIRKRIIDRIKLLSCDHAELNKVKRKYLNGLRIMNLEYHKGYLLEPFFRYFNEIKDFCDIEKVLGEVSVEDVGNIDKRMRYEEIVL